MINSEPRILKDTYAPYKNKRFVHAFSSINAKTTTQRCRFCKTADESIFHILNSCSHLSVSMYLPVRHNEVAKAFYNEMMKSFNHNHEPRKTPEAIFKTKKIEVWWDKKITVQPPVEHNRPDIELYIGMYCY